MISEFYRIICQEVCNFFANKYCIHHLCFTENLVSITLLHIKEWLLLNQAKLNCIINFKSIIKYRKMWCECQLDLFRHLFSETTFQGFMKFGFRVYMSQLFLVMSFQIHHSTTSCLTNTYIILHITSMLKFPVTFFSGITFQGFLKFGCMVNLSQLYRVMFFFRFITQQLPVYQTLAYFYTIKIIQLQQGYHQWAVAYSLTCFLLVLEFYTVKSYSTMRRLLFSYFLFSANCWWFWISPKLLLQSYHWSDLWDSYWWDTQRHETLKLNEQAYNYAYFSI